MHFFIAVKLQRMIVEDKQPFNYSNPFKNAFLSLKKLINVVFVTLKTAGTGLSFLIRLVWIWLG